MAGVLRRVVLVCAAVVFGVCGVANADPLGQIAEFSAGLDSFSSPSEIAPGPDGNLWATDSNFGDPAILRITPTGQITRFSSGYPVGITAGPDGDVWFVDHSSLGIARITPSGQITEFTAGLNSGHNPSQITTGPDGNLWFTDDGTTAAIGRITPSGQITEFAIPSNVQANPLPGGITAGPDGALWFADFGGAFTPAIGRITTSGHITEFSAGLNSGARLNSIVAGPYGDLWFTDSSFRTPAIGRVTPTGQITEFTAGLNSGAQPQGFAAGPDGNLWFADDGSTNAIGRVTPNGAISEFSSGLSGRPGWVAPGPDGNMWFTAGNQPAIGKFGTAVPAASVTTPVVAGSGQQGTAQACVGDRWADWAGQQPTLDGYVWSLDGAPIAGATARTYTPVAGDVGHQLSCSVTVSYSLLGVTDSASSAPVTVIPQASGPTGATGATGAVGSPGATGPQGPAGQVELVTCTSQTRTVIRNHKKVKVKVLGCTTKLMSGPVRFTAAAVSAHATLSRGGFVYATGYVSRGRTRLMAARRLAPGRYTLTLVARRGRRTRSVVSIG